MTQDSAVTQDDVVLRDDDQARILVKGDLVLSYLHLQATADVYQEIDAGVDLAHERYPMVSMCSILHKANQLGAADARERSRLSMKRNTPFVRAIAIVIEAGSFEVSITRTILNAISVVTQRPYEQRVFSNVPEALPWLAPHLTGPGLDVPGLIDLVQRTRVQR